MKHSMVLALWLAGFGVQVYKWNGWVSYGQYHNTFKHTWWLDGFLCDCRQKEHQTELPFYTHIVHWSSPTITYNVAYLVLGSVHWKFPHKLLLCCSELDQPERKIQLAVTAICMGTTNLHKNTISKLVMLSLHWLTLQLTYLIEPYFIVIRKVKPLVC